MAPPTIEPRSILYQSITDQIIRELEHSTVPWHKPWSCGTLDGRILHPFDTRANAIAASTLSCSG